MSGFLIGVVGGQEWCFWSNGNDPVAEADLEFIRLFGGRAEQCHIYSSVHF